MPLGYKATQAGIKTRFATQAGLMLASSMARTRNKPKALLRREITAQR
ncbi:hypothetical protein [Massilia frigida]|nr:hypothetical protein [Massilia frigida]